MNKIILHIPHAKTKLPKQFLDKILINKKEILNFNKTISDLYIDELFCMKGVKRVVFKYSRIFCDVERFVNDECEEMSKFGMGVVYTKTHNKIKFINPCKEYKESVINKYYWPHHKKLNKITTAQLKKRKTILIDCHSFSDDIIMYENKKINVPDICIGFNNNYFNMDLINFVVSYFKKCGYTVESNYPYAGAIIPNKFLEKFDENLFCIMIEVNKRIYLNKENKKMEKFKLLSRQIKELIKKIKLLEI